jgi:hypothetical protein
MESLRAPFVAQGSLRAPFGLEKQSNADFEIMFLDKK